MNVQIDFLKSRVSIFGNHYRLRSRVRLTREVRRELESLNILLLLEFLPVGCQTKSMVGLTRIHQAFPGRCVYTHARCHPNIGYNY